MIQASFPQSKQGGYDIDSKPVFLLVGHDAQGNKWSEVIVMEASMHVTAEDPDLNQKTGRRQVNLTVDSWKAQGYSKRLQSDVVMQLEMVQQKTDEGSDDLRSVVVAKSSQADFPAELTFNMAYTIEVPGVGFKTPAVLKSTASGTITQFPPALEDQFEIGGKQISVAGVDVHSLMCAC